MNTDFLDQWFSSSSSIDFPNRCQYTADKVCPNSQPIYKKKVNLSSKDAQMEHFL